LFACFCRLCHCPILRHKIKFGAKKI
jgi:hypothetical protein